MIELHLIGYTADLEHLVLDLDGAEGGRYRLHVDPDVFATLDELREERRAAGLPVGDLVEFADEIGLDVEELARRQADETRQLAERGLVSAGSAAAGSASAGSWLDDDPAPAIPQDEDAPTSASRSHADPYADLAAAVSSDDEDEAAHADDGDGLFDDEDDWITVSSDEDEVFADVDEVGRWADEPIDATIVLDEQSAAFLSPDSDDADSDDDSESDAVQASVAADPVVAAAPDPQPAASEDAPPPPPEDEFRVLDGWDDADDEVEVEVEVEDDDRDVAISSTVMLIRDKGRLAPRPGTPEPAPEATPVEDADGGLVAEMLSARAQAAATAPESPPAADASTAASPGTPDPEPASEPASDPASAPPTTSGDDQLPVGRARSGSRTPPRPLTPQPRAERPVATPEPAPPPPRRAPRSTPPDPQLSPAEIQSRLRRGASVRAVAKEAGTDEEWIRRWEQPIAAERATVLAAALNAKVERSRLGRSKDPLARAVEVNLAKRHVAGEDISWDASRRRDGRWRVAVSYPYRGRKRSATWTWDSSDRELAPASDAARDLGFTRSGG